MGHICEGDEISISSSHVVFLAIIAAFIVAKCILAKWKLYLPLDVLIIIFVSFLETKGSNSNLVGLDCKNHK